MGSLGHSLSSLSIDGSLRADGESFGENIGKKVGKGDIGPGGGSGGTILLFVHSLALGDSSTISTVGGHGSHSGGGGGGGGRLHFHWSDITVGDEYQPLARINGTINIRFVSDQIHLYFTSFGQWNFFTLLPILYVKLELPPPRPFS